MVQCSLTYVSGTRFCLFLIGILAFISVRMGEPLMSLVIGFWASEVNAGRYKRRRK